MSGITRGRGRGGVRSATKLMDAGRPCPEELEYDPWHPAITEALYAQKNDPPTEKLTYEPQTNEHLKALNLMSMTEGIRSREVPRDQFGEAKIDCGCRYEQMCQICDGRAGSWAFKGDSNEDRRLLDTRFRQYQNELLRKLSSMGGEK